MWAKLNRFVDAVEVDGKFKYYNEVKQNPNQHYEMLHNLSKNYVSLLKDFFLIYNIYGNLLVKLEKGTSSSGSNTFHHFKSINLVQPDIVLL